jgi:hypothetical protein
MTIPARYRNVVYIATVVLAAISGVATVLGIVDPEAVARGSEVAQDVLQLIETLTLGFALVSGYLAKKNLTPDDPDSE